jgi:Ras-related protein Rab-2A
LEQARQNGNPNTTITLVGNKCDLEDRRVVSTEEGAKFAADNGLLFTEASAKTAANIGSAFVTTAEAIYGQIKSGKYDPSREGNGIKFGALAGGRKAASTQGISSSCC